MRGIWLITLFFVYGLPLFSQPAFFDNLVGYWTFDKDTDSIVKDYSGLNNYGTSYDISYDLLPEGKAAVFNSPTSQINIPGKGMTPPVSISSLSSGSISVWFKYENIADGQILPILYFGEEDIGTPHNSLIIEIGHSHLLSNRKLYFTIVNQRFCFDSKDNLEENRWYHFVAVVDENGNSGYLDGTLMTNRNYNLGSDSTYTNFFSSVDSAEVLSFGYGRYGIEDPFFHFKGNIDEVVIFNSSLNEDEVQELYLYGRQKIFGLDTKLPSFSSYSNDITLRAFPNPSNGIYTIVSNDLVKRISVSDIAGKELFLLNPSSNPFSLNLQNVPRGIYFIKTEVGQTLKLINL